MVIYLEGRTDLHMAQLMQLPLTASCFGKIQIGFTFLVPAHPGSPGKRAIKRVCVCLSPQFPTLPFPAFPVPIFLPPLSPLLQYVPIRRHICINTFKTLHQQHPPVFNWRCRLTQVDLYNGHKTVVVGLLFFLNIFVL